MTHDKLTFGQKLRRFHQNKSGAVALLCLAAILCLMLMAWVIIDAGDASRTKMKLQGAADTAAMSTASVRARSMNMIAYTNIAKRSILGISSLYPAMWLSYTIWIIQQAAQCFKIYPDLQACENFFSNFFPIWIPETAGDFVDFWGNADDYYKQDLKALDQYQQYMMDLTPWWSWTEGLVRGWRNGATTATSYPPPPGEITGLTSAVQDIIDQINGVTQALGMGTLIDLTLTTDIEDNKLPVHKADWNGWDWISGPIFSAEFALESAANLLQYIQQSDADAETGQVLGVGIALYPVFIAVMEAIYGEHVDPVVLDDFSEEGVWMARTSSLVFAYHNDARRMDEGRDRYNVPPTEYAHQFGDLENLLYEATGFWSMSKAEITYKSDSETPDMWHPSWTARLRPVQLPGEFDSAGDRMTMNNIYHDVLPYLALTAQLGSLGGAGGTLDSIISSLKDFLRLELISRGLGPSTIDGMAK